MTEMTRIARPAPDEREVINYLTPAERRAALVAAGRTKIRAMLVQREPNPPPETWPVVALEAKYDITRDGIVVWSAGKTGWLIEDRGKTVVVSLYGEVHELPSEYFQRG